MHEFVILPIDIPTLAFSRGFMQMMLGGLLLYVGNRGEGGDAARWWAAGFFLNGLSLFVFPIHVPAAWEPPRTAINHLTLGASTVFFLLGFWAFGRQPRRTWLLVLLMLIPLVSLLVWENLWPNSRLRILCTAGGQALFLILLQQSLRRAPRRELAQIYRRLRFVVVVYLFVVLWSYGSLAEVLPTTAYLAPSYHRAFFSVSSLLFMLSLAVGCLALQFASQAARNADLAMIDWQTGLFNRRGFFGVVRRDPQLQPGRDGTLSVIMLDIDHFKRTNDRYGHDAGDRVLQELGAQLRELAEPGQLAARMGGEEFCIVLPGRPQAAASALAERIRSRCRETHLTTETGLALDFTISVGVYEATPQQTVEQALIQADEALYRAKRSGRDQVIIGRPAALAT
ncbi:MAG: GGDEF domain-containing protein [Rhodanobacteraceae bacterium]